MLSRRAKPQPYLVSVLDLSRIRITKPHSPQDYLADSVDAFLTTSSSPTNEDPFASTSAIDELDPSVEPALPLGLTFSFPVEQTALNEGKILTWTKGFAAKNAVGHDVVQLLQDAFNRKHLHVRCVALVNDVSQLDAHYRDEEPYAEPL